MKNDPAIEGIRKVRSEISREHASTKDFLDHYRSLEREYAARLVKKPSRIESAGGKRAS